MLTTDSNIPVTITSGPAVLPSVIYNDSRRHGDYIVACVDSPTLEDEVEGLDNVLAIYSPRYTVSCGKGDSKVDGLMYLHIRKRDDGFRLMTTNNASGAVPLGKIYDLQTRAQQLVNRNVAGLVGTLLNLGALATMALVLARHPKHYRAPVLGTHGKDFGYPTHMNGLCNTWYGGIENPYNRDQRNTLKMINPASKPGDCRGCPISYFSGLSHCRGTILEEFLQNDQAHLGGWGPSPHDTWLALGKYCLKHGAQIAGLLRAYVETDINAYADYLAINKEDINVKMGIAIPGS